MDVYFLFSGCEVLVFKILMSMFLSIVFSLFGMIGGVKFIFSWSKLLYLFFFMLVIL